MKYNNGNGFAALWPHMAKNLSSLCNFLDIASPGPGDHKLECMVTN